MLSAIVHIWSRHHVVAHNMSMLSVMFITCPCFLSLLTEGHGILSSLKLDHGIQANTFCKLIAFCERRWRGHAFNNSLDGSGVNLWQNIKLSVRLWQERLYNTSHYLFLVVWSKVLIADQSTIKLSLRFWKDNLHISRWCKLKSLFSCLPIPSWIKSGNSPPPPEIFVCCLRNKYLSQTCLTSAKFLVCNIHLCTDV